MKCKRHCPFTSRKINFPAARSLYRAAGRKIQRACHLFSEGLFRAFVFGREEQPRGDGGHVVDGDAALALRPRYAVEASAAWQVIDGLRLAVSYLGLGRNDKGVAGNVNDLSAKLSYTFRKGIGIYVKASNLTGGSNCLWYAYPSAGTRVLGGVSWEF